MMINRNDPRWTAYVLGELDGQEHAEFEKEMESTSDAEAFLAETRDAVSLLREGFASRQPAYLSAEQKRAIEAEAASRIAWFRNRYHWAMGVAAAVVLVGVVTITVPKLLRSRQPADAGALLSTVEDPATVAPPATGSPVSGLNSGDGMESVEDVRGRPARVSELAPSEGKASADVEAVRTTETGHEDVSRPPVPSGSPEKSSQAPLRQMTRIYGQVTDQTGAIVPGAQVYATREATGQVLRDDTDDAGRYNFPFSRPGSYAVEAYLPGNSVATRSGVQVEGERNARIDLVLVPGEISDQVTVSGRSSPPPSSTGMMTVANVPGIAIGFIERESRERDAYAGDGVGVRLERSGLDFIDRIRFDTEESDRNLDNPFVAVHDDPVATFSIDVDTAAYANVRRFLNQNTLPPRDAVRIEEMVNYFTYDYAGPTDEHPVRVHAEVAVAPWNSKHRLLHLGVQGRELPLEKRAPSNLVFLIDISGSMAKANKLPLLKNGMKLLVEQLNENDRVAIVVYAGASGLVLPSTPGDRKRRLLRALDRLETGGFTNGAAGIELAYSVAADHFIKGGTNRVILATDGYFNAGVTDEGALTRLIEEKAETGVSLSVLGFGTGNYNDAGLEALAHHGNGNYAYIDTTREAQKVLAEQMIRPLIMNAEDIKIQVVFNPAEVNAYRLIGSGHTVTALLEVVPAGVNISLPGVDPLKYQTPRGLNGDASRGELLTVKVRYKEQDSEASRLMEVAVADRDVGLAEASTDYRFAAAVAGFGMILRDSPHKGSAAFDSILRLAEASVGRDEEGYRAEFVDLVRKALELSLEVAVEKEDPAVIQALLAAGADPNVRDNDGGTPLHWAARNNENPAVIEALLAAGADPNVRDNYSGNTPLSLAASNRNPAAIGALLSAGAEPNIRGNRGETPLHRAALYSGNPAVIEALVAAGADSNIRDNDGETPLHRVARYSGNPAMIQPLLVAGADVKVRDNDGETPLHRVALYSGNPAVIQSLVAAGADPNVRDNGGKTPPHWAAWNENPAVIEALLAAGADPNVRDNGGKTPLHWGARHSGNLAAFEALVATGADPNVRDNGGNTPLHFAVGKWDLEMFEALLAADADPYVRDPAVVEALVAAGADPNVRDNGGNTPLHFAARNEDHYEARIEGPAEIQSLVAAGADLNVRDNERDTPALGGPE